MAVKYEKLVVVLIEAIKEQQNQISELKNRLDNNL
jgi:flagellar biosynthesis chaperone FliJ